MSDDKRPREWTVQEWREIVEQQANSDTFFVCFEDCIEMLSAFDSLAQKLKEAEAELLNTKELSSKLVEENAALKAEVERLRRFRESDDKLCATEAIEEAELFEQYFNHIEPQPMGTPKQIFRMGFARGWQRAENQLTLERKIAAMLREALEYYRVADQFNDFRTNKAHEALAREKEVRDVVK